ncbi:hypothetical protein ACIBI3_38890 [Actinomadura luteofluorescens]|uniref:hypothetical protein n=1 Tax=Actinomadura luteofluorescens TaxID=46163 RepID=UPI003498C288
MGLQDAQDWFEVGADGVIGRLSVRGEVLAELAARLRVRPPGACGVGAGHRTAAPRIAPSPLAVGRAAAQNVSLTQLKLVTPQ